MLGGKAGGWAAEPELPGAESGAAEPLAADGSAAATSSSKTALSSTFASLTRGEPAKGDAGRERFEGLAQPTSNKLQCVNEMGQQCGLQRVG
jgi:hypothetical protein